MSELDVHIPSAFDPFADANSVDSAAGTKEYVHVRVQQRNGRKCLTTVQGLKKQYSYSKILKDLKKEFCCNGTVVQDPELGQEGSEEVLSVVCRSAASSSFRWLVSAVDQKAMSTPCLVVAHTALDETSIQTIEVIQLQGDQRKNVSTFLIQAGIVKKENIKLHGF
ncbi:protein translation factor SUI1 homolog 2-like isoform X1 [Wolffia australiana]